jgi:uncharacterized membrane protein YGL010W
MKTAQEWFDEYGVSHQNPTNKLIHWICVPTIFFSIAGLLVSIPSESIASFFPSSIAAYANFGSLAILLTCIFYFSISRTIFFGMLLFSVFTVWLNVQIMQSSETPLWAISLFLFIAAWIGQFIGHKIEGKKPSFFKDLQFLLVGPAWLMGFLYKRLGIKY